MALPLGLGTVAGPNGALRPRLPRTTPPNRRSGDLARTLVGLPKDDVSDALGLLVLVQVSVLRGARGYLNVSTALLSLCSLLEGNQHADPHGFLPKYDR